MSTGVFANNNTNKAIEKSKKEISTKNKKVFKVVQITVNCSDGSSWTVSCDGCSTTQLVNIAWALCN